MSIKSVNKRWRKDWGTFRCECAIYVEPAGKADVKIEQTTLIKSIAQLKICFEGEITMIRALTTPINQTITEVASVFSLVYTSKT